MKWIRLWTYWISTFTSLKRTWSNRRPRWRADRNKVCFESTGDTPAPVGAVPDDSLATARVSLKTSTKTDGSPLQCAPAFDAGRAVGVCVHIDEVLPLEQASIVTMERPDDP